MKNIFLLLSIFLILLNQFESVYSAKRGSRNLREESDFDEDEFSEFDEIDEERQQQKKLKPQQAATQKPNVQADFLKFDEETVEDEDDEEFDKSAKKPAQKAEIPATPKPAQTKQQTKQSSNNLDDLDTEEFEHFVDDEEFDGFEQQQTTKQQKTQKKEKPSKSDPKSMPSLKIADVPQHLMSNGNWQNYIWEIVMLLLIGVYLANFLYGKSKNNRLVTAWFNSHRELFEKNFSLVGDDGSSQELPEGKTAAEEEISGGVLIKESESSYGLWCSGRSTCDGMLVQLKLLKRQDLINGVFMQLVKPQSDQIIISVEYPNPDDIDSFVFCLCNKKISQQLFNDYQDLGTFCAEKKTLSSNFGVDEKYVILNEIGEVPSVVLDSRVCTFLNKYPEVVEYLLISDQYVGFKSQVADENASSPAGSEVAPISTLGLPKSRCIFILCLNVPGRGFNTSVEDMERMQPAFQLAMYLIDKVARIRLSKEAKVKAVKKRKDVAEQFMKLTHKQRQEAAMQRKEEKRRAEKEKIMNESDPEKQRRLEEKDIKREKKKSMSKMKQIKIKSM